MKTIGLIGGMSWESTAIYYQKLNQSVAKAKGGLHSAKIHLISLDFEEVAHYQRTNQWDKAGAMIAESAQRLEKSGADVILICTNTMHKVVDQVQTHVPLLHICDVIASHAKSKGISRLGLLATQFTMEERFYADRLALEGLQIVTPNATERKEVHRIIFEELCRGIVSKESKNFLLKVSRSLLDQGVQGLLLGCTELGMSVQQNDLPEAPILDSTDLHCQAAAQIALS